MSGAAAIAAAKTRRGKAEANQRQQLPPPISCGKNNSCSSQNKTSTKNVPQTMLPTQSELVNPTTLQILGPLPPVQILKLHEQRFNMLDDKIANLITTCQTNCQTACNTSQVEEGEDCSEEFFGRISTLESKVAMLEEVIMTLQNKLTIAQNFAMETNLSLINLIKTQQQAQEQAQLQAKKQLTETSIDITSVVRESSSVSSSVSSPTEALENVSFSIVENS
jgi:hypothetical protein